MRKLGKQSWEMLIAGALFGLTWAPISWWPLGLIGWTWWMLGVSKGDQQSVFLKSLLFVGTAWLVAYHWLAFHPIMIAAVTSVVALLAFACLFAAIATMLVPKFAESRPGLRLIAAVLAMLAFEFAVSWGPFAMPSLSAGFAFTPGTWAMGLASWGGIKGVSAAVGLWGALAAWLIIHREGRSPASRWSTGVALLILTVVPLLLVPRSDNEPSETLTIHLVEPNASPEAWSDVNNVRRIDQFKQMLEQADSTDAPPHLTVFPETALPLGNDEQIRQWIDELSNAAASPVMAGGIEVDEGTRARNVAYVSSDSIRRHAKVRLVPFAEHVPFSNLIPGFERFAVPAGGVEGYEPGTSQSLLTVPAPGESSVAMVPLICFESLFFRDARAGLQRGATISAVITQDGWWGSDRARSQHRAFSQLLASATGHPVIHATVDGESALIDASGNLVPLQPLSPTIFRGQLPLSTDATVFLRVGSALFFGIFGALVIFLGGGWLRHRLSRTPDTISSAETAS